MENYSQGYGYWDPYGNFWNGNQGMYQQEYGQGASYNGGYNTSEEISYVENPQDQAYPNPSSQGQNSNQATQNRPSFFPNQNQTFNQRPPQGNFQPRPNNFSPFLNQIQGQNRPFFANNQWNAPRNNNFQGNFPQPDVILGGSGHE